MTLAVHGHPVGGRIGVHGEESADALHSRKRGGASRVLRCVVLRCFALEGTAADHVDGSVDEDVSRCAVRDGLARRKKGRQQATALDALIAPTRRDAEVCGDPRNLHAANGDDGVDLRRIETGIRHGRVRRRGREDTARDPGSSPDRRHANARDDGTTAPLTTHHANLAPCAYDGSVETAPPWRMPPAISDLNRPFWTGGRAGQLLISRCTLCREWSHPPALVCVACGGDMAPHPVSGRGSVFTFTINRHAFNPALPVPYVIAIVELVEHSSLRITSNLIECDPGEVSIGLPVVVTFEQAGEAWVPLFRPDHTMPMASVG